METGARSLQDRMRCRNDEKAKVGFEIGLEVTLTKRRIWRRFYKRIMVIYSEFVGTKMISNGPGEQRRRNNRDVDGFFILIKCEHIFSVQS